MRKYLFLIWLTLPLIAFAQKASSVRFVYIGAEGGDHGTVAICAGAAIKPADRPGDDILGKAYLTDWPTLDKIKSSIAKSNFVMDYIDERLDSIQKYKEARYDKYKIIGVGDSTLYIQGENAARLFFQLLTVFPDQLNNAGRYAMLELLSHTHSGFMKTFLQDFRPAEGQAIGAIQFVYRSVYHEGYSNLPHGTLTICVGRFVQPNGVAFPDPDDRSVILTDIRTYNWLREYMLSSIYTYTVKDGETAEMAGTPICPGQPSLEIVGSGGMDLFVCRSNWHAFFDTLRSELRIQSMDQRVIGAFQSAPDWPLAVATAKLRDCPNCRTDTHQTFQRLTVQASTSDITGDKKLKMMDTGRIKVELDFEKALTQYDFAEIMRFSWHGQGNQRDRAFLIGVGKRVHANEIVYNRELAIAILTDTGTFSLIREYAVRSTYTYTVKDVENSLKAGKPMCPLETSLEMTDSGGMDLFVCHNDWQAFFDSLRSELRIHSLDSRSVDLLKYRLY